MAIGKQLPTSQRIVVNILRVAVDVLEVLGPDDVNTAVFQNNENCLSTDKA